MSLIVHHLNNSRSQRILWLLEEIGRPYEIKYYQRDAETNLAPPELLAVHAGGRSVLDAVEHALGVDPSTLADSRSVLARFGNMSSATILFVLAEMMARGAEGQGIAIAFGPGLAAEAIRFDAGRFDAGGIGA